MVRWIWLALLLPTTVVVGLMSILLGLAAYWLNMVLEGVHWLESTMIRAIKSL